MRFPHTGTQLTPAQTAERWTGTHIRSPHRYATRRLVHVIWSPQCSWFSGSRCTKQLWTAQAASLRGSDDALAARAERFKGTSAAEDAAAEAAAAAAARPFAPFAGAGRSKLRVVNKSDTMRRFYVRLLKSGSVRITLQAAPEEQIPCVLHSVYRFLFSCKDEKVSLIAAHPVNMCGLIFDRCQRKRKRVP